MQAFKLCTHFARREVPVIKEEVLVGRDGLAMNVSSVIYCTASFCSSYVVGVDYHVILKRR